MGISDKDRFYYVDKMSGGVFSVGVEEFTRSIMGVIAKVIRENMTGKEAYEAWLSSYYGSVQEAYAKGVKPWVALPEKSKQAWEDIVTLMPKAHILEEH